MIDVVHDISAFAYFKSQISVNIQVSFRTQFINKPQVSEDYSLPLCTRQMIMKATQMKIISLHV
jgi:hypothetical protein